MNIADYVYKAARSYPDKEALRDRAGSINYRELDDLSIGMAVRLIECGVKAGDRVGIWLEKSRLGVAAMQGANRIGAAYVPVDPQSPVTRAKAILGDCEVKAVVTSPERAEHLGAKAWNYIFTPGAISENAKAPCPVVETDLAYILYTSGSTGRPKGVCISHANARAFIEWALNAFQINSADVLSNHAPFHFDLSVLDLYGAFAAGATVWLVSEELAYSPGELCELIRKQGITIWYSVPSILMMMQEAGGLLEKNDLKLRTVLFAGEAFPMGPLRDLLGFLGPKVETYNLYGPTETNVCTFHRVTSEEARERSFVPIGKACAGNKVWLEESELVVQGPTVMLGYWGGEQMREATYKTGDIARLNEAGEFELIGRKDHMVKVRGHRIELGEIEAVLGVHPAVLEVAVVVRGEGLTAKLQACIGLKAGSKLTLLELKKHCAEHLPRYMIVDDMIIFERLPRTSNGKVDRQKLMSM